VQYVASAQRIGRDDSIVLHPYPFDCHSCDVGGLSVARFDEQRISTVDINHQLCLLEYWNTHVVDHLDAVLSPHDGAQTARARSDCVAAASHRTSRSVWLLVRTVNEPLSVW